MTTHKNFTLEELKEHLHYDPDTGHFTWLTKTNGHRSGVRAGSLRKSGYRTIRFKDKDRREGPLAFFYMTGKWPTLDIDHINRIRDDNRWENLREATKSQNAYNAYRKRFKHHHLPRGVYFEPHIKNGKKYRAQYSLGNKARNIGRYATIEEAAAAYQAAVKELHGEFYADL